MTSQLQYAAQQFRCEHVDIDFIQGHIHSRGYTTLLPVSIRTRVCLCGSVVFLEFGWIRFKDSQDGLNLFIRR